MKYKCRSCGYSNTAHAGFTRAQVEGERCPNCSRRQLKVIEEKEEELKHDKPRFDLDKTLAQPRVKNFIYRVGVELEGGWVRIPDGVDLGHDGSIRGLADNPPIDPATGIPKRPAQLVHPGELNSAPMELGMIQAWMRQSYPSHVNESCGLHVHTSFKSALHYMWLMVPEFQATMKYYLAEWGRKQGFDKKHPLLKRLVGRNQYCKDEFYADIQATNSKKSYNHDSPGNRYTIINYPFPLHGTIECRVLPMFEDVEQAIAAVGTVLDITNASIAVAAQREEKLHGKVDLDDSRLVEVFEETI